MSSLMSRSRICGLVILLVLCACKDLNSVTPSAADATTNYEDEFDLLTAFAQRDCDKVRAIAEHLLSRNADLHVARFMRLACMATILTTESEDSIPSLFCESIKNDVDLLAAVPDVQSDIKTPRIIEHIPAKSNLLLAVCYNRSGRHEQSIELIRATLSNYGGIPDSLSDDAHRVLVDSLCKIGAHAEARVVFTQELGGRDNGEHPSDFSCDSY